MTLMRSGWVLLLWIMLSAASAIAQTAGKAADGSILLLSEENRPFNFTDPVSGQFAGPMTALVTELFQRSDVPYRIEVNPWKRSYRVALARPGNCIYTINRTAEREDLFAWIGDFLESSWNLYAKADSTIVLTDIAAVVPYRVGAPAESGPYQYLATIPGIKLTSVTGPNGFQMMKAGYLDLMATGVINADTFTRRTGMAIRPVLQLNKSFLSIACNKETDPAILQRLRTELAAMRQDGSFTRLLPWLNPDLPQPES